MGILSNNDNNQDMINDFHFPTSKNALIIFVRNPELGKCKTRLAKTIGNEAALEIYKQLLLHTFNVTKSIIVDRFVFYSETIQEDDIWDDTVFRKKIQSNGNLGEKMETAFLELFQMGYENVMIIGSDLFDLKPLHINSAYLALNSNEVVIGPAKDGGYYLLGLSKMNSSLFRNKPWSSSNLLEETLSELRENNIKFTTLETLNDIDTHEDLPAQNGNYSFRTNTKNQ